MYYNEDQLALAIAVSAGMFEVIKARLYSPSVFFDHLVFTNYVRMKKEQMQVDAGKKAYEARTVIHKFACKYRILR